MNNFYATHSPITAPGDHAEQFTHLPTELAEIAAVAQGLVYHYSAGHFLFGYHPPKDRLPEIDTRTLPRIVAQLLAMDNRPLAEPRPFDKRIVGCCRDFSLIACAILRQQGRPARLRYGFASYFAPGYWVDHVVVETWNGDRWQRFDAQLLGLGAWGADLLDLPPEKFISGGRAWQRCRNEGADPARFGLGPDLPEVSGEWVVRGRLQLDVAALNKLEMLCWDEWDVDGTDEDVATRLDEAAVLSLVPDSTALRQRYAQAEWLRVPATVTCYSPAVGPHPVDPRA